MKGAYNYQTLNFSLTEVISIVLILDEVLRPFQAIASPTYEDVPSNLTVYKKMDSPPYERFGNPSEDVKDALELLYEGVMCLFRHPPEDSVGELKRLYSDAKQCIPHKYLGIYNIFLNTLSRETARLYCEPALEYAKTQQTARAVHLYQQRAFLYNELIKELEVTEEELKDQ